MICSMRVHRSGGHKFVLRFKQKLPLTVLPEIPLCKEYQTQLDVRYVFVLVVVSQPKHLELRLAYIQLHLYTQRIESLDKIKAGCVAFPCHFTLA